MERAEFDEIIKPVSLLDKQKREFLISSLVGNFNKWVSNQESGRSIGLWQKCPKCDGQGTVSKPPGVAGDVDNWTSSATSFPCDVCNGAKIIQAPVIQKNQIDTKFLDEVDDILAGYEDWMHGEDGEKATKARRLLIDFIGSLKNG